MRDPAMRARLLHPTRSLRIWVRGRRFNPKYLPAARSTLSRPKQIHAADSCDARAQDRVERRDDARYVADADRTHPKRRFARDCC